MSEIRYDFLSGDYVIIAPERLSRPDYFNEKLECPFCSTKYLEKIIFELKVDDEIKTRVVPNLYKALKIETPLHFYTDKIIENISGFGAHEVIIDTLKHINTFDFDINDYKYWLITLKERLKDLINDRRLVFFSIFKNEGIKAGATQFHAHSQLIAMPVVPKNKIEYFNKALFFYKENNQNIFDFLLQKETNIITETKNFKVFAPYASREAFEVKILSKENKISLIDFDDFSELSEIFYFLIRAMKKLIGDFDFNLYFNTPSMQKVFYLDEFFDKRYECYRFCVSIVPRIYNFAGFELQSGSRINPISPEKFSKEIREYL